MDKKPFSSFSKTLRRRSKKTQPPLLLPPSPPIPPPLAEAVPKVGKKKGGGSVTKRLWMRFDRVGNSELVECDKNAIIKRVVIPARDLRILGPVFSHSSSILGREKAMIVNLEFLRAIVTAEEVLILDPLKQEVIPFVDRLRQDISDKRFHRGTVHANALNYEMQVPAHVHDSEVHVPENSEGLQSELPFEFQVLEIALEVVCTFLDSSVAYLERNAYPVLDELARNVSTKNLEHVRSLKSNLTRLLVRVQKVRDEIEHLLDDNEDMADLYLTRKWIQNQQSEALLIATASNSIVPTWARLSRFNSNRSGSLLTGNALNVDDDDVEDLEMLLETYFLQLDGTRNKILSVREYIDSTEDYVNIQLDNHRNEMIQLQLTLIIASFRNRDGDIDRRDVRHEHSLSTLRHARNIWLLGRRYLSGMHLLVLPNFWIRQVEEAAWLTEKLT